MPIEGFEIRRGVEIPVDGKVHTAEFVVKVSRNGNDLDDAQRHAADLAEKGIEEFLNNVGDSSAGSDSRRVLPRKLVQLIFDATNSKQRSDRIMRASTEIMAFEPSTKGEGWICIDHNERRFQVDADKERGLGRCDGENFLNRGVKGRMPCKHIYALVMSSERFWDGSGHKQGA